MFGGWNADRNHNRERDDSNVDLGNEDYALGDHVLSATVTDSKGRTGTATETLTLTITGGGNHPEPDSEALDVGPLFDLFAQRRASAMTGRALNN